MINARFAIAVVGFLLPYVARLPGVFVYGPDWLWSYFGDGLGLSVLLGGFNAINWGAVLAASSTYRNPHAAWFPVVLGFAFPAFAHASLDLSSDAQAAISLVLIPIFSLPLVFAGWLVGRWFDHGFAVIGSGARDSGR